MGTAVTAMSQARSATAFTRMAAAFDVHESDYLVMTAGKITSFEALAFRFPKEQDFEKYLKGSLRVRGAYTNESDEIKVYDKTSPESWEVYRSSEDCGCLRKLWNMGVQIAKKELEALASGQDESTVSKMTTTLAQELEEKAIPLGMPKPLSDRERPSLHTLGKVQSNFSPGGQYLHLAREIYIDQEMEGRLRRAGKLPKDKSEVILKDDKLTVKQKDTELSSTVLVRDVTSMREVLELRARAFAMLSVASFSVCQLLVDRYTSLLRQTLVEGMRPPTLNEIRKTDRVLFEEILKWVSKGHGKIDDGLSHYLSNPEDPLWKLCSQQVETLPDQGKEKSLESSKRKSGEEVDLRDPKKLKEDPKEKKDPKEPRMCIVCKTRHEPRCEIPKGWRAEQRKKFKESKKTSQKKGSGKGKSSDANQAE